jgi:hypothetical protein
MRGMQILRSNGVCCILTARFANAMYMRGNWIAINFKAFL